MTNREPTRPIFQLHQLTEYLVDQLLLESSQSSHENKTARLRLSGVSRIDRSDLLYFRRGFVTEHRPKAGARRELRKYLLDRACARERLLG